ncbi:hypothetical protein MU985_002837 [Salmonella enterica]|nr:hypothetical protein [Salmonella enterica]EJA5986519.1 hypothetical protein [Salmonella enterica]EJU2681664.1 hypothetical protein [Salmonella enterica]EJU3353563.1 hypothetical protein [Salmonella enterica]EJX3839836.1 hypothetical protein [Salmonella enterica]
MANEFLTQCEMTVNTAAGRKLSEHEMESLVRDMNDTTNRILAGNEALTLEEAAMRAAQQLGDREQLAKVIEARNKAINTRIAAQRLGELRRTWKDRPDIGLEAILVGRNDARTGSRRSVSSEVAQLRGKYHAGINYDFDQAGLVKFIASGSNDREIADAMWRIGRGQKTDGMTPQSVSAAKIIMKWQETARVDENRAGAWIGKMPGYIVRQSHDILKIRAAGYESWRNAILPRLDDVTFDGITDREGFLRGVYDGLASGVHLTSEKPDWMNGFKGSANAAKRASQERELIFKPGGDAWFEYNKLYGAGNIRESVIASLDSAAKTTGLMRVLGTNPEHMFQRLFDDQLQRIKKTNDPAAVADLNGQFRMLKQQLDEVMGLTNIPGNATLAKMGASIRAIEGMTKLGSATLSSLNDIGNMSMEMRYQGMNIYEAMSKNLVAKLQGYSSEEKKEILSYMGIGFDAVRNEVISKFSGDTSVPGKIARLQQKFFKYNLLNWWTENGRSGAGLIMSNWMARNAGSEFSKLNPELRRVLEISGVGEHEWSVFRNMQMDELNGNNHMTPNGVQFIPDPDIEKYLATQNIKASAAAIANARETLAGKLRGYYLDRIQVAMSEPGARTNALIKFGTVPGTPVGEAVRMMMQFKSFTASFMQNTLGRELYGRGYTPAVLGQSKFPALAKAIFAGNGEWQGFAQLFVWMTAFGYLSMQAKLMAKGQTPRPLDHKSVMAAMAQGGGAGLMGDFLFGEYNRFGGGMASSLAGPFVGDVDQLRNLYLQARDGDAKAGDFLRFGINHTPFLNLLGVRQGMDYLILNRMQEWLSPGSLERYEQRVQKDQGNTFMLPPSQFMLGK